MNSLSRTFLLAVAVAAILGYAPAQTPARKITTQKLATAKTPAPNKSALDKPTLEAYVRHLFVWGPAIQVSISDPKPSISLPGFQEVTARGSAGEASLEETFYISLDGQKILRATVFDIKDNPFKPELDKIKTQLQPSFGTPGATVVLVLFSDFECPFCKEEAKMLRQNLLSAYPKQVRVYYKDFPLDQIHPWARLASLAGRCIFRQNPAAFWTYFDWMFEQQADITPENVKSKVFDFAKGKEIDLIQLSRCLETRATEAEINANIADAKALQVTQLPTTFINGRRVVGNRSWPEIRQIIDYEIEYQRTARNAGEDCGCEVKLPAPRTN